MVYNYAVQQVIDTIGTFWPYLIFGKATVNLMLTSDPSNLVVGTVLK